MRKLVRQDQHNGKALEIRLEKAEEGNYFVTVAGITLNLSRACVSGACEGAHGDDYLFIDNETYFSYSYPTYGNAIEAYESYKGRYLD